MPLPAARNDSGAGDSLTGEFLDGELPVMRRRLKTWFAEFGRVLPWRETADPYRVWVSEIMLQQTTVKAVIPYYERFLARFPDVFSLAAASEEDVLQYWEGLGYYSRGRNLRHAARAVCERYGGRFPSAVDELQTLPGIGRYTAGAIRTFAFDLPAPIVEANTRRLYCRLLAYDGDPSTKEGDAVLWSFAERLQPRRSAGLLNQALMELGGMVCLPRNPLCEECPLRNHCRTFATGRQAEIPRKKRRTPTTPLVEATCAIRFGDRYLVRRRQEGERWAGLWDFPRFAVSSLNFTDEPTPPRLARLSAEVTGLLASQAGFPITSPTLIHELTHGVTRYRIRLLCLTADSLADATVPDLDFDQAWRTLTELADLPMPVTGRKFADLLSELAAMEEYGRTKLRRSTPSK